MSRSALLRAWQIAAIAIAVGVLVWEMTDTLSIAELLLYAALVAAVSFLRIERDEEPIGLEAAVVFACIMLFHDAGVALVVVFVGMGTHELWRDLRRHKVRIDTLHRPAQYALAYFVVALLYASAVAKDAPWLAKISGYILLLVGYLVAHLAFTSMRRWFESGSVPLDFRAVLIDHGKVLLIISPIVAAEVLAYQAYGVVGFVLAFLPVLVVGYAVRRAEEAHAANRDLARRNRELSILTESATQITSAEGDQETLRRMIVLLGKLARLKACAIVTWDTNPELPGTVFRFGECLPTDQDVLRYVESAGFAQSAPSRAFVFHNDMRRFPLSSGNAIQIIIGIQTTEIIYGVLIYETEDASILKSGSMNLLTLLASQAAVSMQDQLLRREMREKTVQLEEQAATRTTILDVSNSLIGSFDVDEMLTRIANGIRQSLGFEVVVFALHDAKHDVFVRHAHAGLDDVWDDVRRKPVSSSEITELFNQEFRVSNSFFISHTALRQSEHGFFVRPDEASPRPPDEWHENDILITPLMSGEQVIGYLSVRDPHDRRVPTVDKVRTLEIFVAQAVTGLQSARQYEEIRRLTFIDSLTPAFNHRYFQEALAKEVHRHQRAGREFALAMLDIDNFKRFNDSFGHPVGDEILKGLVDELMTNVRDIDVVARYGGEEFALIFPETPAASARDAANRLRELVERREFTFRQLGRTLRITVSIGVAVFPADGETSTDLIDRADAALYHAKKSGKNRVALAEEVVEGGQLAL
jgi:diguanylate cyclase (GGDEF)-like protein